MIWLQEDIPLYYTFPFFKSFFFFLLSRVYYSVLELLRWLDRLTKKIKTQLLISFSEQIYIQWEPMLQVLYIKPIHYKAIQNISRKAETQAWRHGINCLCVTFTKFNFNTFRGSLGQIYLATKDAGNLWNSYEILRITALTVHSTSTHTGFFFFLFNSIATLWIHISLIGNYVHIWKEQTLRSYPPYLHCPLGTYAQAQTLSSHHWFILSSSWQTFLIVKF